MLAYNTSSTVYAVGPIKHCKNLLDCSDEFLSFVRHYVIVFPTP